MDKIKVSLTSGNVIEKPLISAFRGSVGNYVVLDNEANGTMGLPIILVSKFDGSKLLKIEDQNEWGTVKELLRNIIAGNQMDYITIPNNLTADDMFYSQLTLPIASFESLKANYNVANGGNSQNVQPVDNNQAPVEAAVVQGSQAMPNVSPVGPINQNPVEVSEVASPMPSVPANEMPIPTVAPVMPDAPVSPAVADAPVNPAPASVNEVASPMPSAPTNVAPSQVVAPVVPDAPVSPAPVVEPIPTDTNNPVDYSADKEAFLKACENMFDALVSKFNNKN